MTALIAPARTVATVTRRHTPAHVAAARAFRKAARRLMAIIPRMVARGDFLNDAWSDAGAAVDRAETALLEAIRDRGVAGIVVDGRLYLDMDTSEEFNVLAEWRGCNVLVIDLKDVPDLAR